MNKTFKIVFNKARGALMVANELTGSVQKKGVSAILVTAAVALSATAVNASSAYTWGENIPEINESTFVIDGTTGSTQGDYYGIHVTPNASGTLDDLSLDISAIGPKDGTHADFQLIGFANNNNQKENDVGSPNTELSGKSINIKIKTDFVGGGNNQVAAIMFNQNGKISAENVSLNVASTAENGKSVYGMEVGQGTLTLASRNINITLNTATDRGESKDASNYYSEANGIDIFSNSTVDASSISSLVIKGTSSGKTATTNGVNGGSSITGIVFEGGTGNFGGTTHIELSAVGGNATGVKATNYFYNSTMGENWGDATGTLNNLEAAVSSELATAAAVGVAYNGAKDNTVLLAIKGDSNLIAKTNTGKAYGINLSGKTTAEILGNIAIDVSASGEKGVAYGVNVSEGNVNLGSLGTTLKINAKAADAEAIDIVKGGTVSFGDASNKLSDVSLNTNGSTFTAYLSESTLNVYSNNYSQTGSGHGLYVTNGSSLTMDVDSFDSTTDYTAIHTRTSEKSVANVTAKTFKATATGDDTGVALLQANEGSTLNVTAETASLTGTHKLGGGVMGSGTYGTINLKADKLTLDGNINGVYGGVDNKGKKLALNVTATDLAMTGDINVGSLGSSKDTYDATSDFSRNTAITIEAQKANITGNINVWGNKGSKNVSTDENTVSLKLGSNSVFTGNISVIGTKEDSQKNSVTLTGGTYNVGALKLENRGTLTLDEGRLVTAGNQVFKSFVLNQSVDSLVDGLTLSNSELALTDTGTISQSFYESAAEKVGGNTLNFLNATITLADSNNELSLMNKKLAVGSLTGNDATKVILGDGSKLTLHGTNQTTNLEAVDITGGSSLALINSTTLDTSLLTGGGDVQVGDATGSGATLRVGTLGMTGGSIFVDPADTTHAYLEVRKVQDDTLKTAITAGHGSLISLNATLSDAQAAAAALQSQGLTATGAMAYVGTTLTLGEGGKLTIDAGAVAASNEPRVDTCADGDSTSVVLANNSTLIINQSTINGQVFRNATMSLEGGQIGIVNATAGTILLTDSDDMVTGSAEVLTDTPFIEATLSGNTITNTVSTTGGLGALASTGIQAMTRRADTVLAQTIADRTSVDQELAAGTNLWVDVTGERYEADKLDNGGEFKSDMGYGAFGADFAVTQDITAGAAFQYGKGSLRSGVSSIKNSIDSYGVTAYGAMKFGDSKVVAEASYIKNENDITSSQTALNQSVDSEIYSVGVRGQHRFTAGNFQFVPSVGVRVSRLNTDAMQVGAVNIKKQEQTLVQVPIALRVNGFEQNVSGWSVAPSFKIAYVPTFGDKEISVLGADQTVIDTSPVQGDFGIRAQNGNLMVNANMMLGGGKDGASSVGGKVGLKYVF